MIIVLKGSEKTARRELFEQHLRFRYEVFQRGRGWSVPGGSETDPYDDDDAVYFFDLDEAHRIQASVRITPTIKSSLIADYFPHLVENGQPPRAPAIYERTRLVVQRPHGTPGGSRHARSRVTTATLEWCLGHGIAYLQTVIDYGDLPAYLAVTPLTIPLGLPHPYNGGRATPGGGECMAVRWPICPQLLADVRNYFAPDGTETGPCRLH